MGVTRMRNGRIASEATIALAPLTVAQRRLWLLEDHTGAPPHQIVKIELRAPAELATFLRGIGRMDAQGDVLRHRFQVLGSYVVQYVGAQTRLVIQQVPLEPTDLNDEARAAVAALDRREGALAVFRILSHEDGGASVIIAVHSLVADPETLRQLVDAIASQPEADGAGTPVQTLSLFEYALAEQRCVEAFARAKVRWEHGLTMPVDSLPLALVSGRNGTSPPALVERVLDESTFAAIREGCVKNGWSMMAYLFSAMLRAVAQHYATPTFVAYFAHSLRTQPSLKHALGHFTNFAPIVCRLDGGVSFSLFLKDVQAQVHEALADPYLPLTESVLMVNRRFGARDRLQVLFTFIPDEAASRAVPWEITDFPDSSPSGFAWHFVVRVKQSRCTLQAYYRLGQISGDDAEKILGMAAVAAGAAMTAADLPCLELVRQGAAVRHPPRVVEPLNPLEVAVFNAWERVTGLGPDSPTANFFDAGGTSIGLAILKREIWNETGRELAVSSIMARPTFRALCELVQGEGKAPTPTKDSSTRSDALNGQVDACTQLFRSTLNNVARNRFPRAEASPTLLIAGSTGFIGRYLVRTFLERSAFKLICLARPRRDADVLARLEGIPGVAEAHRQGRLEVLAADLADPWSTLPVQAAGADVILNAAAAVNFVYPFDTLVDVNVNGLLPLLRAADPARSRFIHLSTLGIHDRGGSGTDCSLLPPQGGYPETKWVSDHALQNVASALCGMDILRPGWIIGDERTGAVNRSDIIWRLVRTIFLTGLYPRLAFQFNCSPVERLVVVALKLAGVRGVRGELNVYDMPGVYALDYTWIIEFMRRMGLSLREASAEEWTHAAEALREAADNVRVLIATGLLRGEAADLDEWRCGTPAGEAIGWPGQAVPLSYEIFSRYAKSLLSNPEDGPCP